MVHDDWGFGSSSIGTLTVATGVHLENRAKFVNQRDTSMPEDMFEQGFTLAWQQFGGRGWCIQIRRGCHGSLPPDRGSHARR